MWPKDVALMIYNNILQIFVMQVTRSTQNKARPFAMDTTTFF